MVRDEIKNIVFETLNKKWEQKIFFLVNNFDISSFLQESDSKFVKIMIWQPKSITFDLTAFLTNMTDGCQTLLNFYFAEYKREIIRVKLSDSLRTYPLYSFECMKASNHRIIQAMKDTDKWKFFENGTIMPFENKMNYRKRKISDRLNNKIIEDYLTKYGIDITLDNFWISNGKAIEFSVRL